MKINSNQKQAIESKTGAYLVVAGAGTGKTRVITERIRQLIQSGTKSNNILALTFTDKACGEMVARLDTVMPLGYEDPWLCTFHSFAERILREEGLEIGLDTSYKLITEPQQWILLRKNLFNFNLAYYRPLGNPTKFISAILRFISRLKDETILPEDLLNYAKKFNGEPDEQAKWLELAHIYTSYEELKLKSSKLDFGDLILWTTKLFNERPAILKKYQKLFCHILVDEFQDTNYAQYELVKLLFPKSETHNAKRSFLVVGDDSQAIYRFRGAAVSNILEFQKDYPDSQMITLLHNYRSNQQILDSAYKLIKNNDPDTLEYKLGISKKLVSEVKEPPVKPKVVQLAILENEVEFIIQEILEILAKEPQYTYKDFAILARANSHLDPFILGLRKYGLPYQLVGNRGLYDRDEIRDIMALLKVIINPLDAMSLYRVLTIATLGISSEEISHILAQAKYNKVALWEIVKTSKNDKVLGVYNLVTEFQKNLTKKTPTEIVYTAVSSIDYTGQFIKDESVENELKLKNLDLFLTGVKKFEVDFRQETKTIPTLLDFMEHITFMIEAGENPAQAEIEDIDTINLLTIHASKGLEFSVVFMINLVSDRFPTRDRKDVIETPDELIKETLPLGDEHLQEERRLFYVGMTRAKKYLYLTYAKNYGGKRDKTPSGFIQETGLKTSEPNLKQPAQTGLFGVDSGFRDVKVEKIKSFVPDFLSYTQISTYLTCPLQYKYAYVLKIPTPPNHALSFGSTIHNTLRDYHTKLMFKEKVAFSDLLKIYEDNWQPLGYLNEEHRTLYFENGKKLLDKYYAKHNNAKTAPLFLEKSFNLRIDGVKFYGRIDRIDPLADGGVEIIDYKTGNTKTQKEVDKDAQVAFYAMGASEALQLQPKKLTLYYVESGEQISTTRTSEQIEEKKTEILETVAKIKAGDFNPTPGKHCSFCDYNEICPYRFKD